MQRRVLPLLMSRERTENVGKTQLSSALSYPSYRLIEGYGKGYRVKVKVKQSRYRPGVAQRVPGS